LASQTRTNFVGVLYSCGVFGVKGRRGCSARQLCWRCAQQPCYWPLRAMKETGLAVPRRSSTATTTRRGVARWARGTTGWQRRTAWSWTQPTRWPGGTHCPPRVPPPRCGALAERSQWAGNDMFCLPASMPCAAFLTGAVLQVSPEKQADPARERQPGANR